MSKTLIVDQLVRDEGTILVLQGHDPDTGRIFQFAADHRLGWAIVDALDEGEEVPATIEPHQVLVEWSPTAQHNGQHGHANTGLALAAGLFGAAIASSFGGMVEVALFLTIAALLVSINNWADNRHSPRGW